jgi:preprotein translocase subunit SecA
MDWDQITDKFGAGGEAIGGFLRRLFGARTERMVRELGPLIAEINGLEEWAHAMSGDEMKAQTAAFKASVASGEEDLDDILPRAFAMCREAALRTLGMRHFDVQLVGGIVLHRGSIAEMMTGEGKTLVATLPLYLNALSDRTSYLITVNDYLARRDAYWMGPIYEYLGLTFGAIQSEMSPQQRQAVYACDIVYGTNNEFGFDYLRDNMKTRVEDQVQKDLYYGIIDEVDSILIDEARTPLIISGPAEQTANKYAKADEVARLLQNEEHFEVKEKERQVSLLEAGIEVAEKMIGVESFYDEGNMDWPHYIENALRAHFLYERDTAYVVEEGEVIIVDEFTGRKMNGRRWSDGLHQAVETKEGLRIRQENQTMATITFQNYFRLYEKLAGMTGTAITEAGEFHKVYGLDVVQIPTNLPIARDDDNDLVYRTEKEKWKAIVDEIEVLQKGRGAGAVDEEGNELPPVSPGQPVLVGTTSIEKSELLSGMLSRRGVKHEVLNAKQHEREARIVAVAGERESVTVATNMAGRGTDIKLGGNFEWRLAQALEEKGLSLGDEEHLAEIDAVREEVRAVCDRDEEEVRKLGGLYVLGTERHEARRIDNQLRGRSGRQGDPGVSRFFLSLQDDLMRRFYRDWVTNFMERLGMTEGQAIESPMVTRAIKKAQKKVEDYHFEIRKNLLEYDEVMDEQRKTIYSVRQEVLESVETKEKVVEMLRAVTHRMSASFIDDAEGFRGWFHRTFGFDLDDDNARTATDKDGDIEPTIEAVLGRFEERESELGAELMRQVERYLLLDAIDGKWKDHLHAIDQLKAGIGLRGYAQKDPKNEYKAEGYGLFQKLLEAVEDQVASLILRVQVRAPETGGAGSSFASPPQNFGGGQARHPAAGGATALAQRSAARRAQGVPASRAFDAARYRSQLAARAEAQKQAAQPAAPKEAPAAQASAASEVYAGAGRNDPCPCGSGKKFKKCHGKAE